MIGKEAEYTLTHTQLQEYKDRIAELEAEITTMRNFATGARNNLDFLLRPWERKEQNKDPHWDKQLKYDWDKKDWITMDGEIAYPPLEQSDD